MHCIAGHALKSSRSTSRQLLNCQLYSVAGAAAFTVYGSADQQDFSNNEPFGFEDHPAVSWIRKLPFFDKTSKKKDRAD
jgi:hypothetical protein